MRTSDLLDRGLKDVLEPDWEKLAVDDAEWLLGKMKSFNDAHDVASLARESLKSRARMTVIALVTAGVFTPFDKGPLVSTVAVLFVLCLGTFGSALQVRACNKTLKERLGHLEKVAKELNVSLTCDEA